MINDDELAGQLEKDFNVSKIDERDKAMLKYVRKLTIEPWSMVEGDVIKLREKGFSDEAILDIVQITGYYAFVNRLSDGLGVELESFWQN